MNRPDYSGHGITNLMASLVEGLGGLTTGYPCAHALPAREVRPVRNVVLFVIDGLGYRLLETIGRDGFLHSRLRGRLTSVFPSTTATAVTTFLTAQPPQQHGLTGWFTWFRELGDILAVLPFVPRHKGPPLTEAGIDPVEFFGHTSMFDRIAVRGEQVMPAHIAHSAFNRGHCGHARVRPYEDMKGFFRAVRQALKGGERSFVHAYWADVDGLSHEFGPSSPEVADHVLQLDAAMGEFVRKIDGSDTLVVVTADHGLIDTAPELTVHVEDHPPLADSLLMPLSGEPRAAYCYIHPHREQTFLDYCRGELGDFMEVVPSRELLRAGWFGTGQPHPALADRIGHYTLIMKDHFTIKDHVVGERVFSHLGVHGGVSEEEMFVPLIIIPT